MTADVWLHLASALRAYRTRMGTGQVPDGLLTLEAAAVAVMRGQERPTSDAPACTCDGDGMAQLLLTTDQAAKVLAVSESTVRRLIDAGQLDAVTVGERSRRIRRSDLETYVAHLNDQENTDG